MPNNKSIKPNLAIRNYIWSFPSLKISNFEIPRVNRYFHQISKFKWFMSVLWNKHANETTRNRILRRYLKHAHCCALVHSTCTIFFVVFEYSTRLDDRLWQQKRQSQWILLLLTSSGQGQMLWETCWQVSAQCQRVDNWLQVIKLLFRLYTMINNVAILFVVTNEWLGDMVK